MMKLKDSISPLVIEGWYILFLVVYSVGIIQEPYRYDEAIKTIWLFGNRFESYVVFPLVLSVSVAVFFFYLYKALKVGLKGFIRDKMNQIHLVIIISLMVISQILYGDIIIVHTLNFVVIGTFILGSLFYKLG
jgi:hypothetical protein